MNLHRTRILIVDDHFMVRKGLADVLAREPDFDVVGQAPNGREALDSFAELLPDITLMDGVLPDMHGEEVIRRIVATWPDARIIMLSINDTEEDVYRAMDAGAWGYIPKSSDEEETIHAIHSVAEGNHYLPPHLAAKLSDRNLHVSLSEREMDVLHLVADGKTNKEIAVSLGLGSASVKTYLARVFTKLGASDRTQAVTVATQRGILRR